MCWRSRRYAKSGSTRSTPRCSSRGNASPASMTTIASSASTTIMFLPTSPRPPSGISRHMPSTILEVYGRTRHTRYMEQAPYRFDDLGWLQFERLCAEILGGAGPIVDEGLEGLPGPTLAVVAFVRTQATRPETRLRDEVDRARDEWSYAR